MPAALKLIDDARGLCPLAPRKKRAKAENLFDKTNGCGMIIGEIVTGDVASYDGLQGVPVLEFKLWPESEWIKSPGGLGVRHMPEMT